MPCNLCKGFGYEKWFIYNPGSSQAIIEPRDCPECKGTGLDWTDIILEKPELYNSKIY